MNTNPDPVELARAQREELRTARRGGAPRRARDIAIHVAARRRPR